MSKKNKTMLELLPFALLPYATLRIISYLIFNPRPYLWWHGLIDLVVVVGIIIVVRHIIKKEAI